MEIVDEIAFLRKEIEELKSEKEFWTKEIRDLETYLIRKFPGPYLEFEVHLAEHCNLNCKGCDHFSPIAEPEYADYSIFCRDFQRMQELFQEDVKSINLLGGEPLLNLEIVRFLEAARYYFPKATTEIRIVTNGILLLKMEERFWNACASNNIIVALTKYPINLKYEDIFKRAETYQVKILFYDPQPGEKKLYRVPLKLKGDLDAKRSYYKCANANQCCFLKNGRLYTCTLIPNIEHFNRFFGVNLPVTNEDSIDIFEAKDKEEVLLHLSHPKRFCRFCDSEAKVYELKWEQSRREMEEWLADNQ